MNGGGKRSKPRRSHGRYVTRLDLRGAKKGIVTLRARGVSRRGGRTSDTRCWSDEVERKLILIWYWPCEAALQSDAAFANEPDGSGNTYQLSVTGPLLDDPQPAIAAAATATPRI